MQSSDNVSSIPRFCVLKLTLFPLQRPRWKSDLNAYRVEAAWKLSKWDLVEDYLASGKGFLMFLETYIFFSD